MMTKKCFWVALMVMCTFTLHMNGQNETLRQKYERLAKDADANPTDWKKQYEAAHMLIDKESELYDQIGAGKYYERIYHLVADVNPAVPDSVFTEAGITLMFNALNHQDFQNAIFYGDELKRFVRQKKDDQSAIPVMVNTMSVLMQMAIERPLAGGSEGFGAPQLFRCGKHGCDESGALRTGVGFLSRVCQGQAVGGHH